MQIMVPTGSDNQDERVQLDSFVVYPTDYDLIPYSDRDNWALTVRNGHAWGWSVSPGIGRGGGGVALDRDGKRVLEQRADEANRERRWPMEEALQIALDVVDNKHAVMGQTAAQVIANREAIIASFERPGGGAR